MQKANLLVDDVSLVKKGEHSVGVARQWCGELGKNANCQTLVSLALVRGEVPITLGLRLFLPQAWAEDQARRNECGVPEDVACQPKWRIALEEIDRVLAQGALFGLVQADAAYGMVANFRQGLSLRQLPYTGQPAVSVDAKKKELVGDFRNGGQEYQPQGQPEKVRVHDFEDKALGKAIPYGVYDLASNEGWVSVGVDHDTAQFAAHSILLWWREMGRQRFPRAKRLLITADGGGSNASRSRLWKKALQELADELGLELSVCHFPPGTSKWNKIEHRLFSFITQNWRGKPLESLEAIVSLIGATKTKGGLTVKAHLDTNKYAPGIEVSDEELASLRIDPHKFHGEWNYTIKPRH